MIQPTTAKKMLKSTGVTLQHVSNETQVNYSYLNEWINGKRILVYGECLESNGISRS